jgi:hypothetical protein
MTGTVGLSHSVRAWVQSKKERDARGNGLIEQE